MIDSLPPLRGRFPKAHARVLLAMAAWATVSVPAAAQDPAAPSDVVQATAAPGHWWDSAGDPVLAHLIARGLSDNRQMRCEALALHKASQRTASHARRIDVQIKRLFASREEQADAALLQSRAYRHAGHRADLAAAIASAYIEVRRLQEVLALRETLQAQYDDNARIAAFRREAGLVSGIDTGLAGSLLSVTTGELDALRLRHADAVANLSRLSAMEAGSLEQTLGKAGLVPDITARPGEPGTSDLAHRADLLSRRQALAAQLVRGGLSPDILDSDAPIDGLDAKDETFAAQARSAYRKAQDDAEGSIARARGAVIAATGREADLEKRSALVRGTVDDARLGYRNGTEGFATLFVAEAAALAIDEARVTARAALADAAIRLWTELGGGWDDTDLMPDLPPQDASEVLVCE